MDINVQFICANIKKGTNMSTSFLYHAFGLKGYKYVRTKYKKGKIIFSIKKDYFSLECPCCKSKNLKLKGTVKRTFKAIPIGSKEVYLELPVQRIECHSCKIIRQVKIGFADSKRTYTKSFERHVLDLSKHMTIKSIAKHLKVGWDLIKDIQKRYLNKRFSKPSLKNIENIAIDEICVGKNHKYLSIVLNLTTGRVIFVGEGRGADALVPFWKRLNRLKKEIKYVAIDMSPAYISAVTKNLPGAEIVFDFFHIVKLYNEKLSKLRRQLFNITESIEEKEILKGTRWLLLKNENCLY